MDVACRIEKLHHFVAERNYKEALLFLNELKSEDLKVSGNEWFLSYQVYLNIRLGNYEKACRLYEKCPAEIKEIEMVLLYYAYALYKLGYFLKSLAVVQQRRYSLRKLPTLNKFLAVSCKELMRDTEDERLILLEAQILYRLGMYRESLSLYKEIEKAQPGESLLINIEACRTHCQENFPFDCTDQFSCYELVYNRACVALAHDKNTEAEELLDLALKLCYERKEEDAASTDVEKDIYLIQSQIGYLNQLRGFKEEAMQLYQNVYNQSRGGCEENFDSSLIVPVTNNVAVLENMPQHIPILRGYPQWFLKTMTASSNPMEPNHLMSTISYTRHSNFRDVSTFKLTSSQFTTLMQNYCITLLESKRFKQCERYLACFPFPSPVFNPILAQAQKHQGKFQAACDSLYRVFEYNNTKHVPFLITALMLLAKTKAIKEFERLVLHVGLKGLLLWNETIEVLWHYLYLIRFVSPKIIPHFLLQAKELLHLLSPNQVTFNAAFVIGKLLLDYGEYAHAMQWYEYADSLAGEDVQHILTAAKIQALCHYDILQAEFLLDALKANEVCILPSSRHIEIDPDEVDRAGTETSLFTLNLSMALMYRKYMNKSLFLSPILNLFQNQDEQRAQMTRKARRSKRPRYPKGVDPLNLSATLPDPERWLPKRERSSYKKSKKIHGRGNRSSQGSTQNLVDSLDVPLKKASTMNMDVQRDTKRRINRRSRK